MTLKFDGGKEPALGGSMRTMSRHAFCAVFVCFLTVAAAQEKPAYLDPGLPPEQRAASIVKEMTLDEKVSQLVNQARAIPRLNIPAYDWWSESLHGVINNGTTQFPEPVGLERLSTRQPSTRWRR